MSDTPEEIPVVAEPEPERKVAITLSDKILEELKKGAEGNIRQFAKKNCTQCNGKGMMTYKIFKQGTWYKVERPCDCIVKLLKKDIRNRWAFGGKKSS